jgi:hypothetical protein
MGGGLESVTMSMCKSHDRFPRSMQFSFKNDVIIFSCTALSKLQSTFCTSARGGERQDEVLLALKLLERVEVAEGFYCTQPLKIVIFTFK